MDRHLRTITLVLTAIMFLTAPNATLASGDDSDSEATIKLALLGGEKKVDLSFASVFDQPFYREGYFPWAVLATTIVVAGVVSFATFGGGAPAAATGVSAVASAVAGGGAGSYMAGLSIVGGWFGGNAMVGAAILNGLSLGVGGGGTAWAYLSATGKVAVVASVTATTLDGVLLFFAEPSSKELSYRIILPVPSEFGTRKAQSAANEIVNAEKDAFKAIKSGDKCGLQEASERRDRAIDNSRSLAESAIQRGGKPEHLLVLAILRKNAGDSGQFQQLLGNIDRSTVSNQGYLHYLKAIMRIENGELREAEQFLWASWRASPYAIEAPILLVNLLGFQDFENNERKILFIVDNVAKQFDGGKYDTPYSLLALHYRIATQYYIHKRFPEAETYYRRAYSEIPHLTRHFDYFGRREIRTPVELGIANSLYGQGKTEEADAIFDGLLDRFDAEEEKNAIKRQYVRYAGLLDATEAPSPVEAVEIEGVKPDC